LNVDLDAYISKAVIYINAQKSDIDEFTLTQDLKQFILDEAEKISKSENISITAAVHQFLNRRGTPEEFGSQILSEIHQESKYLIAKILVAVTIALSPILFLVLSIIR
jgi:hypothetical protein